VADWAKAGTAQAAPIPAANHVANDAASGVRRARAAQGRVKGSKSENRIALEPPGTAQRRAAAMWFVESIIHEGFASPTVRSPTSNPAD